MESTSPNIFRLSNKCRRDQLHTTATLSPPYLLDRKMEELQSWYLRYVGEKKMALPGIEPSIIQHVDSL
jgi:hypothetical protein